MITTPQNDQIIINNIITEMIQEHFMIEELRTLVTSFIQFKQNETTVWWKLPLYLHNMLGGQSEQIHYIAAQAELLILSLDIIDDLQDLDNFKPPWMHCDRFVASNIASALLIIGTTQTKGSMFSDAILKQLMYAHNGQYYDYLNLTKTNEQYYKLIEQKSSALIALVLLMGYQLTSDPTTEGKNTIITLANYIGIAAQLQNDLKDLHLINERSDIVQRKRTIATMYLLERCDEKFPILQQYYDNLCTYEHLLTHQAAFTDFVNSTDIRLYIFGIQHENGMNAENLINSIIIDQNSSINFKKITSHPFLNKI